MSEATLIAHNPKFRCEIATREQLAQYATPTGTSTWRPIPHAELVGTIHDQLRGFGITVKREQYAVGKGGLALFGVMELLGFRNRDDRGVALGLRHANDKDMSVRIVGGTRVFVCDNLALSGEHVALKKHSRLLQLAGVIREGLGRFLDRYRIFDAKIEQAENTVMSDDAAKVKLFDLRYSGVLPVSIFDDAASNYFRASDLGYEDSKPRTSWGLHNACTRAVKALTPMSQFNVLNGLGRAFALAS
jgi:hypothetical protein